MRLSLSQIEPRKDQSARFGDWFAERATRLLELLLEAEVDAFLGRPSYGRADHAPGLRNGYKLRCLRMRDAKYQVRVPQVRGLAGPYRSAIWQVLRKQADALELAVLELYSTGPTHASFRQLLTPKGEMEPMLSAAAIDDLVGKLKEEHAAFRARALKDMMPVCLSVGMLTAPGPAPTRPQQKSSAPTYLISFAKCADGSEPVLDVVRISDRYDPRVVPAIRDLRARGLPPPLLFGGIACPYLRSFVTTIWSKTERLSFWDDLMHQRRHIVAEGVLPHVRTGYRELCQ